MQNFKCLQQNIVWPLLLYNLFKYNAKSWLKTYNREF